MKSFNPNVQPRNNMRSGPRMGLRPFNPRTSDYMHTTPNGTTSTVNRGGMPNSEGLTEMSRRVGMGNFRDSIMPRFPRGGSATAPVNRNTVNPGMSGGAPVSMLRRNPPVDLAPPQFIGRGDDGSIGQPVPIEFRDAFMPPIDSSRREFIGRS